jgi:hypothetical protein
MDNNVEFALDHLQYLNGKLQKVDTKEQQYVKVVLKAKIYVKLVFVIWNSDYRCK